MKCAILLGRHNTGEEAARLVAAARAAGSAETALWLLGTDAAPFANTGADEIGAFGVRGDLLPDGLAPQLAARLKAGDFSLALCRADRFGSPLAVRLAALAGGACCLAATGLDSHPEQGFWVRRRVWGLQLQAEFALCAPLCALSLSLEDFPAPAEPPMQTGRAAAVRQAGEILSDTPWCAGLRRTPAPAEKGLDSYDTVLIGGRGLGSAENAKALMRLARAMGAAAGATRPAVYSGWFNHRQLVGASGVRIAPRRCLLFGVSGCVPLLLGIKNSRHIIAVNTDENAPVFDHCHTGVVASAADVIQELLSKMEERV